MKKKYLLSLLLICSMFFGMLQMTALAAEETSSFRDVKATDWFYEAVQFAHDHNLMSGTGNGNFSPKDATTRSMMVTILYNLEGKPEVGDPAFTDVPADQWYAAPVAWANANEIVTGYGNGTFGPDDPVTREQMVTILYQYAQYKQYDLTAAGSVSAFYDSRKASAYARTPFQWAIGKGLISGVGNYQLDPLGNADRSQIAAVMKSFWEKVMNNFGGKRLFQIDPSKVISITVRNGDSKLTQTTITKREQMEEIVKLVNGFTYISSQKVPPASGCGYSIHLKSESGKDGAYLEFYSGGVKLDDSDGEPGSSIHYYGKAGYFDSLIELADQATDPI